MEGRSVDAGRGSHGRGGDPGYLRAQVGSVIWGSVVERSSLGRRRGIHYRGILGLRISITVCWGWGCGHHPAGTGKAAIRVDCDLHRRAKIRRLRNPRGQFGQGSTR